MTELFSRSAFVLALVCYGASSVLYFVDVARSRAPAGALPLSAARRPAPWLLGAGALGHAGYMTFASFIAHVCPVHSAHFLLSMAALLAIGVFLVGRRRFRIDALGLVLAPLGLVFVLGTFFLGQPSPDERRLSPLFIGLHVLSNLLGVALFLLAGGAAALYLFQERRLKQKRGAGATNLPPLDTLDRAVHRFLVAGFPLLTMGVLTGTLWAKQLELGSPEELMRTLLGYATWLVIASVLLLRAAAGWRGRRAAYGTIAGLACVTAVLVLYLVRPAAGVAAAVGG